MKTKHGEKEKKSQFKQGKQKINFLNEKGRQLATNKVNNFK